MSASKTDGLRLDMSALRPAQVIPCQWPVYSPIDSDRDAVVVLEIGENTLTATLEHASRAGGVVCQASSRYAIGTNRSLLGGGKSFLVALGHAVTEVVEQCAGLDVNIIAIAITCVFDTPFIAAVDQKFFDSIDSADLLSTSLDAEVDVHSSASVTYEQEAKWQDDFLDAYLTVCERDDENVQTKQGHIAKMPSLLYKLRRQAQEKLTMATGCSSSHFQSQLLSWLHARTEDSQLRGVTTDIATKHILTPTMLAASVLSGKLCNFTQAEASVTGLRDVRGGHWHAVAFEAMELCTDVWGGLSSALRPIGEDSTTAISATVAAALRLGTYCKIVMCPPASVLAYLSRLPGAKDSQFTLDRTDELIVTSHDLPQLPATDWHILPNPLYISEDVDDAAADCCSQQKMDTSLYLARSCLHEAGVARDIVKQGYTKTWKAFAQLVAAVGYGGTNGLDEPLFAIYISQGTPKGIWRYEHGTRVSEFSDLRASARCLLETQALEIRRRLLQLVNGNRDYTSSSFAPESMVLPEGRLLLTGSTEIVSIVADVFANAIGLAAAHDCSEPNTTTSASSRISFGATCFALYRLQLQATQASQTPQVNFADFVRRASTGEGKQQEHVSDAHADHDILTPRPRPNSAPLTDHALYLLKSLLLPRSDSPTPISAATVKGSIVEQKLKMAHEQSTAQRQSLVLVAKARIKTHSECAVISKPDCDIYTFYGSLLEEYTRLHGLVQRHVFSSRCRSVI